MKTVRALAAVPPSGSLTVPAIHQPTPATIFHVQPRVSSRRLAAATFRSVVALAIFGALLLAAHTARAQSESVLYNFTGGLDGAQPEASLTFHNGNLYGTTETGGILGYGVVFELAPNGNGGWNQTVLHEFALGEIPPQDGGFPTSNVIFDSAGNIYGTTMFGSAGNCGDCGTVFELTPNGTSWTQTILYSFMAGDDGAHPQSGLIMDAAGNLYGTTSLGGPNNTGTVFELSRSGDTWTEKIIYAIPSNDSIGMYAGLAMDGAGNLYGASGATVFELSPNGNGGWNPSILATFSPSGKGPFDAEGTLVLDQAGNLYGTSAWGGANNLGTVYKLTHKNGSWQESVLYSFPANRAQGSHPWGGVVLDAAGNIYGTAMTGGLNSTYCQLTCGTVFELSPVGGSYEEKTLAEFNYIDGSTPMASLVLDSAGKLYGTTFAGGALGGGIAGTVFEVNPSSPATTTALTSSPNPSLHGQAVTFTAVVTSSEGVPPNGESVSFTNGKKVLGTGTLSTGTASFTTSALKVGTTAVTAEYAGDFNFAPSSSNTVEQVVNKKTK
jgi:uncharacterized repeat protein (TIGR03803 family)